MAVKTDVVLLADAGDVTVARRTAFYTYGKFEVILPEGREQQETDNRIEDGYIARAHDGNVGRFDFGFIRADATVNIDAGTSDLETQIDSAELRAEGDVFFEGDITPSGFNGFVPGVDYGTGDIVTVRRWGTSLALPVTSIELEVSESAGTRASRVHVSGQLIHDAASRRRSNDDLRQQIAAEKRERLRQVGAVDSKATQAKDTAEAADGKADSALQATANNRTYIDEQLVLAGAAVEQGRQYLLQMEEHVAAGSAAAGRAEDLAGQAAAAAAEAVRILDQLDPLRDDVTAAHAEVTRLHDEASQFTAQAAEHVRQASAHAADAVASASSASQHAADGKQYAADALAEAGLAEGFATSAFTHAEDGKQHAANALAEADRAQQFVGQASSHAETARGYVDQAKSHADEGTRQAGLAAGSASAALQNANRAQQIVDDADGILSQVQGYSQDAKDALADAESLLANAGGSGKSLGDVLLEVAQKHQETLTAHSDILDLHSEVLEKHGEAIRYVAIAAAQASSAATHASMAAQEALDVATNAALAAGAAADAAESAGEVAEAALQVGQDAAAAASSASDAASEAGKAAQSATKVGEDAALAAGHALDAADDAAAAASSAGQAADEAAAAAENNRQAIGKLQEADGKLQEADEKLQQQIDVLEESQRLLARAVSLLAAGVAQAAAAARNANKAAQSAGDAAGEALTASQHNSSAIDAMDDAIEARDGAVQALQEAQAENQKRFDELEATQDELTTTIQKMQAEALKEKVNLWATSSGAGSNTYWTKEASQVIGGGLRHRFTAKDTWRGEAVFSVQYTGTNISHTEYRSVQIPDGSGSREVRIDNGSPNGGTFSSAMLQTVIFPGSQTTRKYTLSGQALSQDTWTTLQTITVPSGATGFNSFFRVHWGAAANSRYEIRVTRNNVVVGSTYTVNGLGPITPLGNGARYMGMRRAVDTDAAGTYRFEVRTSAGLASQRATSKALVESSWIMP